jgi:FKBP-type peptidyl-prolyl cis-trans isomerase
MLKNLVLITALSATFFACDKFQKERQTTESGLGYQIVEDVAGTNAVINDFITVHLTYSNFKDSILGSTYQAGKPITARVAAPQFKGSFEEGLTMLSKGDSAVFWVPTDSIFKGEMEMRRPPFLPKGTDLKYTVRVINVESPKDIDKNQDKKITEYAASKGLKLKKTDSGLYYTITKDGNGIQPVAGDTVSVHYTGMLLTGEKFDSSLDRNEPFEFPVGMNMVIKGWDEGLQLLKEGTKATLVIPSRMGYGEQGAPGSPIGPNEILVFDVELLKVKRK